MTPPSAEMLQAGSVAPHAMMPLALLVMDDERELTDEIADAAGHRGYVANAAEEALRLLDAHSEIGVMLTDIRMPRTDGLHFSTQATHARPDPHALEVIIMTGHATPEEQASDPWRNVMQVSPLGIRPVVAIASRHGGSLVLVKPVTATFGATLPLPAAAWADAVALSPASRPSPLARPPCGSPQIPDEDGSCPR